MKISWLNDALTIKSENERERHALAVLLEGMSDPKAYMDSDERPEAGAQQASENAISR